MADSKITALTALTSADPANDMIPIVDVSDTPPASGNTKRISINNLLACSPSATLASATITGALGAAGLNVTGATIPANGVYLGSANNLSFSAASALGMTLNSTGLGVGISPSYKLNIGAANPTGGNIAQFYNNATSSLNGAFCLITQFGVQDWYMGQPAGVSAFTIGTGTTSKSEFFRIDGSGNVGIGVTPSAGIKLDVNGNLAIRDTFNLTMGFANQQRILAGGTSDNTYLTFSQWTGAAYTERVRIKQAGQVRFVPLAADPAGAEAGDVYYNSSSNKLKCYNGTTWNDLF